MRFLRMLRLKLRSLVSRGSVDRDLDDELRYHLDRQIEEYIASGMSPDEARRSARRLVAGVEQRKEECRDARGVNLIDSGVQDVRYALRQLAKNPAFTCTAILMLVLGMGASVAVFGFVDVALVRPLPYPDPSRLVEVNERTPALERGALSYQDYLDWKRLNTVFSSLDIHAGRGLMLRTASGTELVPGARVSSGFFRTLGIAPMLGRDFRADEDLVEAPDTVILSHAAWQSRFGGRPEAIGQTVTLNGIPHTIVGVLPADFEFAPEGEVELWTTLRPSGGCELRRSCHFLAGVARLADGISVPAALAEMTAIASQLEKQYPDSNRDQHARVVPLTDAIVGDVRPILLVLAAGAALLLVIACVNAASLLLVRSESRKRELAVRSALGASRGRLIRQFVTEGIVLVGIGGVLGLAVARWSMTLGVRMIPTDMIARMPYLRDIGLNGRVLACAALIALVATCLFSLTPALRVSWTNDRSAMAEGGRGSAGTTWHRLGFELVVLELATAMVLLVGAGLLAKSLHRLLRVELGFRPERLAMTRIAIPRSTYATNDRIVTLAREMLRRTSALPGVESAALTSTPPVTFNGNTDWIRFVGRPYNGEHNEANLRDVSRDYFRTLGAKLIRGRDFSDADGPARPKVVVINQALAARYFPGEDPIGTQIGDTSLSSGSIKEIIGIVEDIREGPLDAEIWPAVYYPFEQDPDSSFALLARTAPGLDERSILPALVASVHQLDPDIGTTGETTMSTRIAKSPIAYLRRSSAWVIGAFALVAALLGVVGLYGVIAYSVSQRTREIGVRIAMGAQRASVYQLVLTQAGRLIAFGIGAGLVCSVAGAALMRQVLFATPPWDVPTLTAVAAVLAAAALVASYIPARRAASIDPVEALRGE
jgi:macrolide transport system ATP-binding/permease protein